jgi:hypothetical protein
MAAQVFAPAQLVGYLALILGVTAFLQRNDQRLRLFSASQCIVYALHFYLLGNVPAAIGAAVSSARSAISMRYRSPFLVVIFLGVVLWLGLHFARGAAAWLPIVASGAAAVAMFLCRGITMRVILLGCTLLWLVNNLLCGSIGGTILEILIATINSSTIVRMVMARAKPPVIVACGPDCAG